MKSAFCGIASAVIVLALAVPSALWYERLVAATGSSLLAWIGGAVLIFGSPVAWHCIALWLARKVDA